MSDETRKMLGVSGENQAESYLRSKGLKWVASNWRTKWGEIDLIMKDGRTLVFVEVKTRKDRDGFGEPEEAVHVFKQSRILKSAMTYLQKTGTEDGPVRFDVVSIGPFGLRHIPDAFMFDDRYYL